jgi:hypothetical protein
MKFAQIKGFLDMISVSIIAVRDGVRLGSDYLRVLCVSATQSRVTHGVEAVRVAWWSGDRCDSSFKLPSLLGQLTSYDCGPGWAKVGLS